MRRLLTLLLVAGALSAPAAARAQSSASPFAPQTPTAGPVADADQDSGGMPGWAQTLIILAGVVVVLGIGLAIARDARSVAGEDRDRVPDRRRGASGAGVEPALPGGTSPARVQRAKARARKRGRTARASRKRNR